MEIVITVDQEELDAVNGVVVDAEAWLQAAWDGKANSCLKRVISAESNLNPSKMSKQDQKTWVKDNTFKTRVEKDAEAEQ